MWDAVYDVISNKHVRGVSFIAERYNTSMRHIKPLPRGKSLGNFGAQVEYSKKLSLFRVVWIQFLKVCEN
jgi:hypothetical protein